MRQDFYYIIYDTQSEHVLIHYEQKAFKQLFPNVLSHICCLFNNDLSCQDIDDGVTALMNNKRQYSDCRMHTCVFFHFFWHPKVCF